MHLWYTKCCAANLYPTGALIQEEALQINERIVEAVPELNRFHASSGWLKSFKMSYGIQEAIITIVGEAADVSIMRVKAWMGRLPELIKDYLPEDILNMNKLGLFF